MKLETTEARMGHAPNTAICEQGVNIQFEEELLMGVGFEGVEEIRRAGGRLPDHIAQEIARTACPNFRDGRCVLGEGTICRR